MGLKIIVIFLSISSLRPRETEGFDLSVMATSSIWDRGFDFNNTKTTAFIVGFNINS